MNRTLIKLTLAAAAIAMVAGAATTVPSGPNKVAFPADWNKGVMYATVDRYDTKQYREFYTSAEAVNSMQKSAGFGDEIPVEIRNGDWQYQSFTPDGKVNDKANLTSCYECHKPFAKDDYLTNVAKLAGSFTSTAHVAAKSGPADVTINGFSFGPGKLAVAQGQRVTWTNADDTPHVIAITGKDRRSDLMLKGQSSTLQFDEAGTFD